MNFLDQAVGCEIKTGLVEDCRRRLGDRSNLENGRPRFGATLPAKMCLDRYSGHVFAVCVCLSLIPVLWFRYLPTSDGPSHVYNSKLILDYFVRQNALAHDYYQPNAVFVPNWIGHVFMAAAMFVLSPLDAERLLIAGYLVLLPLAFRYALRSVSRNTACLEFLALPLLYNSHLHWGFYNFCYSLIFYLFALGFWIRHSAEMDWRRLRQLFLLVLLTYFSHPIGFVELFVAVCFLLAWELFDGGDDAGPLRSVRGVRPRLHSLKGRWGYLMSAFLPVLVLYAVFLRNQFKNSSVALEWPTLRYASSTLLKLDPLRSFGSWERYCSMGISVFLAATLRTYLLIAFWKKSGHQSSKYLSLAPLCAVLVILSPASAADGTMITPRLVYFPVFVFLLWVVAQTRSESLRPVFLSVGLISALTLQVLHWPVYKDYDRLMKRFVIVADYVDSGKSLLFVTFRDPFPQNLDAVTRQANLSGAAGAYIATLKGLVYLNNYEAETHQFPFVFQSRGDPIKHLFQPVDPRANALPSRSVDLTRYERDTGRYVDYVLLWGLDTAGGRKRFEEEFAPQLRTHYEEVDTHLYQGVLRLYRRRSSEKLPNSITARDGDEF